MSNGYNVTTNDIQNTYYSALNECSSYIEVLPEISSRLNEVSLRANFQGAAADSFNSYVNEVHGTLNYTLLQILQTYISRFILYFNDFCSNVDGATRAVVREEEIDALKNFFSETYDEFLWLERSAKEQLNTIYDIKPFDLPSGYGVCRADNDTADHCEKVIRTLDENESAHKEADFTDIKTMIDCAKQIITARLGSDRVGIASYASGSLLTMTDCQALLNASDSCSNFLAQNKDNIDRAFENEKARYDRLVEELSKERAEKGFWDAVVALGTIVVGAVTIVATAGAATPLVVAGIVAGGCTMAYGVSNLQEAEDDIVYGLLGDPYTAAFNPLRDTIFGGNQELYDKWGQANMFACAVISPINQATSAVGAMSTTASTTSKVLTFTRVVGTEVGKDVISGAVGYGVGETVTELTGNEKYGAVAGTLGSMLTGIGLTKLDAKLNISGLHPKAVDMDVPEKIGANAQNEFDGINGGASSADDIIRDGSQLENGKLKPNVKYQAGEHEYFYTTDENGLIVRAQADDLQFKTHDGRLRNAANTPGKMSGDQAGHLIGDRFGGSPELDNLVSQAKQVNLSEYKKVENIWAKAIEEGKTVSVDIKVNYEPGSIRPSSFDVQYSIDGRIVNKSILN